MPFQWATANLFLTSVSSVKSATTTERLPRRRTNTGLDDGSWHFSICNLGVLHPRIGVETETPRLIIIEQRRRNGKSPTLKELIPFALLFLGAGRVSWEARILSLIRSPSTCCVLFRFLINKCVWNAVDGFGSWALQLFCWLCWLKRRRGTRRPTGMVGWLR